MATFADRVRAAVTASAQLAAAVQLDRARREVNRIVLRAYAAGKVKTWADAYAAILATLKLSADPDRHEVLGFFDVRLLAKTQLAAAALGAAVEAGRLGLLPDWPEQFAEEPWAASVKSFLSKQVIGGKDFDKVLQKTRATVMAGGLGDYADAEKRAYANNFTMIRESNAAIVKRAQEVLARGLGAKFNPTDLEERTPNASGMRLDLDNLYSSLGIAKQDPWYSRLVVNNAVNRAYQEGADSVAKTPEGEYADFVWGFEWIHGHSHVPRAAHLAMDKHVAPKEDAVWRTFGPPPIAHNCSCVRQVITHSMAEARGLIGKKHTAPEVDGVPVTEAARQLPGNLFPESAYGKPTRDILNPTGFSGKRIRPDEQARLDAGATAKEIIRGSKGEPVPVLPPAPKPVPTPAPVPAPVRTVKPTAPVVASVPVPATPAQTVPKPIHSLVTPKVIEPVRLFTEPKLADEWGQGFARKWKPKRNTAEFKGLYSYKKDAVGRKPYDLTHQVINVGLRKDPIKRTTQEQKLIARLSPLLDASIARSVLQEPVQVWRSLNSEDLSILFDKRKIVEGTIIPDGAYMSTSLLEKTAAGRVEDHGILVDIVLPKGSHAAYMDSIIQQNQQELLTARVKHIRVKSAWRDKSTGLRRITAEVEFDERAP